MQLLNEQFNSIYLEYNETQLRNSRLLLERQKEIHAKIPEIAELDRQISELSLNAVKLALDGSTTDSSDLNHDIKRFLRKKLYFSHSMAIRKTTYSLSIVVQTAGIQGILVTRNVTAFANGSSHISMNNPIFKTFLKQKIFHNLMKNIIQMTM